MVSRQADDDSIDRLHSESTNGFKSHETMLRDRPLITAYYDAIMSNKHLFENKVVLDVGCGTGVLSIFAAKAGAKLVYAVDSCSMICHLVTKLVNCNHLQDKIQVVNKRIEDVDKFDENIDIIISEWMGFYLFDGSMLDSVIYARDHFLNLSSRNYDLTPEQNESITIFPSHAYLYCAPFVDQHVRIEYNSMWKDYFGLNMLPIVAHLNNANLKRYVIDSIEPSQLVHDAQLIQSIDLSTIKLDDLHTMRSFCEFEIDNSCIISGFCFWFDCYFSSNNNSSILRSTRLTTSPYSSITHWKQTLVFLPNDMYPLKGDIVPVNIKINRSLEHAQQYQLSVSIKKIKEGMIHNATHVDEEISNNEPIVRRRQRRRSSTISLDKRLINDNKLKNKSNDSTSSNSDDDINGNEHPIPCSCAREGCILIKTIFQKYHEESIIQ